MRTGAVADSATWKRLNDFMALLRKSSGVLSRNTLLTLRGQALSAGLRVYVRAGNR